MRRILQAALLCIAALLTGCATTRVVDSDVQAFSTIQKVGEPATFRFERLPSQQAHPQDQAALEAIAKASLARVGLTVDEANARFSVQVDANVQRVVRRDLWNDPWHNPWGGSWGHPWGPPGWHGPHRYFGSPFWGPTTTFPEPDLFMHEVHIVMRDLKTQHDSASTWWDHGPGRRALDKLFMQGDVMIRERKGMEKHYVLPAQLLPAGTDLREPSTDEMAA